MEKKTEHKAIDKVFAFPKGSIDTSHNAGDQLKPIESFNPTVKNIIKKEIGKIYTAIKSIFSQPIGGYIYDDNGVPTIIKKDIYDDLTNEEKNIIGPIKPIYK